jgi:hypothetical protein
LALRARDALLAGFGAAREKQPHPHPQMCTSFGSQQGWSLLGYIRHPKMKRGPCSSLTLSSFTAALIRFASSRFFE